MAPAQAILVVAVVAVLAVEIKSMAARRDLEEPPVRAHAGARAALLAKMEEIFWEAMVELALKGLVGQRH